ncbi:albumin-binding GA domain-containing protein, partial [Streptococcus phocae subsp. phocae]
MEKNKQVKYCLRKSVFGLASVSAALIVGSSLTTAVNADDVMAMTTEAKASEDLSSSKATALDALYDDKNLSDAEKASYEGKFIDAASVTAVDALTAKVKQDKIAKNLEGFSEGLNTLTGSEVKTVEDYKLEFAKDAALKEFDKYGVSDFYKKMIEKAGTVEGVQQLQSEVVEAAKANRIQEGTEGLVDFLKEQTPAEDTVKAIELAEAKAMALKEFDKYGVSDFYKKMIEKAGTVEGVQQLQSEVVEAAKANRIQEGTE